MMQMVSVLSIAVGACSLALMFYVPIAALCVAIFGLGLAAIGMQGARRSLLIIGLVLGSVSVIGSGIQLGRQLYMHYRDELPWNREPGDSLGDDPTSSANS